MLINLLTPQLHQEEVTHSTETTDVGHLDKAYMLPRMEASVVQACAVDELIVGRGAEARRITARRHVQTAH
jgi:hypothetical protein